MAGNKSSAKRAKRHKKAVQASVRRRAASKRKTGCAPKKRLHEIVADDSAFATLPIDDKYHTYLDGLALDEKEKTALIGVLQGTIERILDRMYGLEGPQ